MRHLKLVCAILALAHCTGAYAQTTAAKKQQAQADGLALGAASRGSGSLTPQALSNSASAQGASNVWGVNYNGNADPSLTGLSNSSSMIEIGSNARNKSVGGFKKYDGARGDQANQATYFLDKNHVLKPTISPDDPIMNPNNLGVVPDIFSSNSTKICKQTSISTKLDDKTVYTCSETFNPYVVSCSEDVQINVGKEATCNMGQQYSVSMSDNSGMGKDQCQGGDAVYAAWTCSSNDYPSISMSTNSKPWGSVGAVIPTNGSVVVNVDGYCHAKFENSTNCLNGQCSGTYTMILGVNSNTYGPYPDGCTTSTYFDENGTPYQLTRQSDGTMCEQPVTGTTFTEQGFGSGSRIAANGKFSMSRTVFGSYTSSSCAALEGLAQ